MAAAFKVGGVVRAVALRRASPLSQFHAIFSVKSGTVPVRRGVAHAMAVRAVVHESSAAMRHGSMPAMRHEAMRASPRTSI